MDSGLVLGCFGRYFTRPDEFAVLCDQAEAGPEAAVRRGRASRVTRPLRVGDGVADKYEKLAIRLSGRRDRSTSPVEGSGTCRFQLSPNPIE